MVAKIADQKRPAKTFIWQKRHTKPLQNVSKIIFILPDLEGDPLNFL